MVLSAILGTKEGADNIVYSGLGYSPNFNNLKGSGIIEDLYNTGLTPSIKLDKAPESYGDGNVVMLFNNRISLAGKAFYDSPTNSSNQYISNDGNGPIRKANFRRPCYLGQAILQKRKRKVFAVSICCRLHP